MNGVPVLREVLRTARRPTARVVFDVLLAAAGIGIAVWRLAPTLAAVDDIGTRLTLLRWPWVALACTASVASLVAYGELLRRLLVAGGARVRGRTVQAVNFVGNAIAQTVPSAGATAGVAYTVAALRARGADTAGSVWSTTVAALTSGAVLIVLSPALLAGAGLLAWPAALGLVLLFALLVVLGWRLIRRPAAPHVIAGRAVAVARHLPLIRDRRWVREDPSPLDELLGRLVRFRPSPSAWTGFLACALASWVLDFGALVSCVAATGSVVTWFAMAVGYLAVQVSIGLQLTPAGAGPAEAGLLAALVAGGVPVPSAALAVVLYRTITWLGLTAAGWLVFAASAARRQRNRYHGTESAGIHRSGAANPPTQHPDHTS